MGQTLSEPVRDKKTDMGGNTKYIFGVSEMQGWRVTMEDAHTTLLELSPGDSNAYFAVYDGHGGSVVAKYAGEHVYKLLRDEKAYKAGQYKDAFKRAYLATDQGLIDDPTIFCDTTGCTAVGALITDSKIYVANAGDSRAVLSMAGKSKALSYDHKPSNKSESVRIMEAGGYIQFSRVNGNLSLSRAIGDLEYKKNDKLGPEKQIVTSNPDVSERDITDDDEFFIVACDGIWDVLSSQKAVSRVRRKIAERKELGVICEEIMDECCAKEAEPTGSLGRDNMTIIVVGLLHGRTKAEWYDWIASNVERDGTATPPEVPEPKEEQVTFGFLGYDEGKDDDSDSSENDEEETKTGKSPQTAQAESRDSERQPPPSSPTSGRSGTPTREGLGKGHSTGGTAGSASEGGAGAGPRGGKAGPQERDAGGCTST
ncbi:hypothetical protein BOTBODRAFT_140738 [Botryobasidium botryosum FD-172 SS1]|uniref:protein-serine/threonine phosphatase n=1 Tax=Botryobasidium botryosum (strain FD-172 SS1) TaxID=930990 RepID=A0A067M4L2_BOTB1|nr:hypothetical protein BOTBODRAFT_140738 [Botryobasidium botryosum FD-172 SS1]